MLGTCLREGNQFDPGPLQVAEEGKWKLPKPTKDYACQRKSGKEWEKEQWRNLRCGRNPEIKRRRHLFSRRNGEEGLDLLSCRAGNTEKIRKQPVEERMETHHSGAEDEACTDL